MPNWCSNLVDVTGPKEAIDELLDSLEDQHLTFQQIMPMPKELEDLHDMFGRNEEGSPVLRVAGRFVGVPPKLEQITPEEEAALKEKYGQTTWYWWRVDNWSTKWDIDPTPAERVDDNTARFIFDTAWSPPHGAIRAWSLLNAQCRFTLVYCERGVDFFGIQWFEVGESDLVFGDTAHAFIHRPKTPDGEDDWDADEWYSQPLAAFVAAGMGTGG